MKRIWKKSQFDRRIFVRLNISACLLKYLLVSLLRFFDSNIKKLPVKSMLTRKKVISNGIYKIFKTAVCVLTLSMRICTQWTKPYAGFARRTRGNDQKITQSARFRACIWGYVCRRTRAQSRVWMWMLKTPWSMACAAPRITPGHLAWKISGVHSRGCTGGSRVLYSRARANA